MEQHARAPWHLFEHTYTIIFLRGIVWRAARGQQHAVPLTHTYAGTNPRRKTQADPTTPSCRTYTHQDFLRGILGLCPRVQPYTVTMTGTTGHTQNKTTHRATTVEHLSTFTHQGLPSRICLATSPGAAPRSVNDMHLRAHEE